MKSVSNAPHLVSLSNSYDVRPGKYHQQAEQVGGDYKLHVRASGSCSRLHLSILLLTTRMNAGLGLRDRLNFPEKSEIQIIQILPFLNVGN